MSEDCSNRGELVTVGKRPDGRVDLICDGCGVVFTVNDFGVQATRLRSGWAGWRTNWYRETDTCADCRQSPAARAAS